MKNINMFEDYLKTLKETERVFKEQNAELTAKFAETDRIVENMGKRVDFVAEQLGGIGNNNGAIAEEYFFNSFKKTFMFNGEHFNKIKKNELIDNGILKDEYDIVLYNGKTIIIIEVKYKAHEADVQKTLKKVHTFKQLQPEYANYTFKLGLASLHFTDQVENSALDAGIAVVKQVGENVVVMDERVKKF